MSEIIVDAKEYYDMQRKLCEHDVLEKDVGVDLTTLFKALKNGIWYKLQDGRLRYMQVALRLTQEGWTLVEYYPMPTNVAIQLYNPMHRYGIVWALTKEELL